jgi:hypothetical protein
MTGQQLLTNLLPSLIRIGPSEKNIELYQEIQNSFSDFIIIDSFNQIRRSHMVEGLALEIMFFNKEKIVDIVISSSTINFIIALTKKVNMVYIETSYIEVRNEAGILVKQVDALNFTISYGEDKPRTLIYNAEVKRFDDVNRIQNSLLNLISK